MGHRSKEHVPCPQGDHSLKGRHLKNNYIQCEKETMDSAPGVRRDVY